MSATGKSKSDHIEALQEKIKTLNSAAWEGRVNRPEIDAWLVQFQEDADAENDERLHALFLLSHFIYFGQIEIRELLRSLYRDLYRSPLVRTIRKANGHTLNRSLIETEFDKVLRTTRFLGIGNPSESGSHLLYYFRQQNRLPKTAFINSHEIFSRTSTTMQVRDPSLTHYVFIDDLCGSGKQATQYSKDLLEPLKQENPNAKAYYFVLFATTEGLKKVRDLQRFDEVAAVFELDESFRSLEPNSRIFHPEETPFLREKVRATCVKYGTTLWPQHPLGYENGQLLMGFNHNTPDNTLPIFWRDEVSGSNWTSIFRRYDKDYGW